MVAYIPKRGDFIRLNFNPQAGHEQKGARPALVVSHSIFNKKMGFVFVCPISNTKRKNPFYVAIPKGKKVTGVIMGDQLRSVDYKSRKAALISKCPEDLLQEVLMRIDPIIF
ncbi:MAG: type II toxin-antitoxin system PemK/MazF family toxin [Deltaproteobacteria bacterium]|nr:type II toxin-antitoxin system PemK/MazF family toxin [Deltaproteobacteria bacterium]MBW1910940.1 type II toxin-antitoxin system PemK/MazF family toxin [Deltaproteobacteria bacterium]MBW2032308.1 type II toxin-antitoxin system PemK/MazF family toxin [Deltaproteobacteria bacterium]MBW2169874.1 type II toxin-antitoxin system PemK/MazF family toxin [Deltaproteobacteria bacterium]